MRSSTDHNILLYKLDQSWATLKDIVIFGYGRVAERNINKLNEDFNIVYAIDNGKAETKINDISIFKLDEVEDISLYKIVVTTASVAYESIKQQLESKGLNEYYHFCRLEEFLLEWYWRYKKEVCLSQIYASVTTRCTFKCRNCSALVPYYDKHIMNSKKDIINDLDALFNFADYLSSYYLVGGEPFLNPELGDIVEEICLKYRNRIGCFQIITNGSILPSNKLIGILKKNDIFIRVSDYTETVSYEDRYKQVLSLLEENNINHSISKYTEWFDMGLEKHDLKFRTKSEIIEHMKKCSVGCHQINDGKMYFCGMLYYSEKAKMYNINENDIIDLRELDNDDYGKTKLLKYLLEGNEDGISLCAFCGGYGVDNSNIVKAGEQIRE